ncbi:MAG: SDR family NAD(P)-dependent oxidoreductase [Clostridia bacterium]|nr:SDR family NAD(P)-dependent oxidoreductase [Clostridia bacterium]
MKNKKVVIITGTSSGIGLQTANYFSDKGYTVYGVALGDYKTDKFTHYVADVCDNEKMKAVFEEIYNKEGQIDIVINNAGIGISGAIEYVSQSDLSKIFDINVKAVISISAIAIPYLRLSKGKIINTSSVAAPISIPFQACYSATKSAIEGFSQALANEVRPQGIKVCCVRPGDTKTGFTSARIKTEVVNDVYGERIKKSIEKMEKDEQGGTNPIKISKQMYKVAKRKNPPLVCTVGFGYKTLCALTKFLPKKFVNWIVYKIY